MTNRKFAILSKKLFLLNIILSLITHTSMVHTGLTELYHLKTTDGKSILLAGDNHSLSNFSEIMEIVDLINAQEQSKKSITLLVEQALNHEYTTTLSSRMLVALPRILAISPLHKTEIKNIEIRTIANAILTLLNPATDLNDLSAHSFFQNGNSPKIEVSGITFQHLYDEYHCLRETLSTHYQKYDDVRIQQLFKQQTDIVEKHYAQLQRVFNKWKNKYGIKQDEVVVSLIRKIRQAEQSKSTQKKDDAKEHALLSKKLSVYIFNVFGSLFDINAFDQVMQHTMSSDIVLMVAGFLHTDVMKDWLISCDETLVQSIVNNDTSDSYVTNNVLACELATTFRVENPA